jgi:hypothetical protein
MPTIDELPAATAASDTDELITSQGGTARKVTRAQLLSGVQPELAMQSGYLLGRSSAGTGDPESITIGANLTLAVGTLTALGSSYLVSSLPLGTVPAAGDLVPLGQSGSNTAVTYGQFLSGLPGVANVDGSALLVKATGATSSTTLAAFAAGTLPRTGGTLTGGLTLAADPTSAMQAATKEYVDSQVGTALPKSGGTMSGPLSLAADPTIALQAATKNYADTLSASALPKSGGTLSGGLTLAGDPSSALQASTKQYVDTRVFRTGDTLTGPLTLAANPVTALQAATKQYVDSQTATALPLTGGVLGGPLTLAANPATALQAATKQYVDGQATSGLPLSGGTLIGPLTLAANPAAAMQAATKQYVDTQTATALPLTGGTLTGALTLAANPTGALNAATRQYVDLSSGATGVINVKVPPYNAQLNGTTDDTAAFKAAYQAAPAGSVIYVPNGVTNLQNTSNWGIPLTKWVKWIVDGTTLQNGTSLADGAPGGNGPSSFLLPGVVVGNSGVSAEISQGVSQPTDFAVLHTSYVVNHTGGTTGTVASANRTDTFIFDSPNNFIWGGLDRLVWAGNQTPTASAPAQHVSRYIQTVRQVVGTNASGTPLPQPQLWTACLEYRDVTGQSSSVTNASITAEMDWFGNGPDDGNNRQIQSLVVGQNNSSGAPVEISNVIGVYLAAGSTGHAYQVFSAGIPFSTSVLDTTNAQQMAGAAAIRMASGHAIAFEPTNSNKLYFDSTTNALRWTQSGLSWVVGRGITVGFQNVCSANTTLGAYLSGNIVFLTGTSAYTVTLPAASTVAAGVGFTFSVVNVCVVAIATSGSDAIDNGPITLRQNDRYHIISDGSASWHEVFRANSVNPRFTGVPILPCYSVQTLPATPPAGSKAFATNGRKPADASGAGTGVEVFGDGTRWISVSSGTPVQS